MARGIVFCHGHKHRPIDEYYMNMASWLYCDANAETEPDVVVDLLAPDARDKILTLLPEGELFDYILSYGCPLGHFNFPQVTKNIMLLGRSILKVGGYFIFDNYFSFAIGHYMDNFHIVARYLNNDIKDIHGLPEARKIKAIDDERYKDKSKAFEKRMNLDKERKIYELMLQKEDKKDSGPLLDYCLSIGKTMAVETGYSSLNYLDNKYRPKNKNKKELYKTKTFIKNDSKCFTLMFRAGSSLIQENLQEYISDGYYQNDEGYIVSDE